MRKLQFSVLALLLGVVGSLVLFELGLRAAAVLAPFGSVTPARDGAHFVVLCMGDSHTWGSGRGYPARLSAVLGERSSAVRVVNLGIPGTNTAQLRNRLPRAIESYHPDVVVVWAGINNIWNRTETEDWAEVGTTDALVGERLLVELRVWRFYRAWQQQLELGRWLDESDPYTVATQRKREGDPLGVWHLRLPGAQEVVANGPRSMVKAAEVARVTELDIRRVVEESQRREIPLLLITYPQFGVDYQTVNRAIEAAAVGSDAAVITGADAIHRIQARRGPRQEGDPPLFDRSIHPTQPLSDKIGDLLIEAMDARGLRPEPSPSAAGV